MKFRWTMKELEENSDNEIIRGILSERMSDLHPYAPLHVRLAKVYKKIDKLVQEERS